MKILKTLALALALLLALSACGVIRGGDGPAQAAGGSSPAEEPAPETAPESPEEAPPEVPALRVGALKGPTAMGLIRMIADGGVNRYLLEQVLRPNLEGELLRLGDIDFGAFDADDVPALEDYYDRLYQAAQDLSQFAQTLSRVPPTPRTVRSFC